MADQYTRSVRPGMTMKPTAALKLSGKMLIARASVHRAERRQAGGNITDAG